MIKIWIDDVRPAPKDSHIGDCCKGRRKTCFGYGWRYEN